MKPIRLEIVHRNDDYVKRLEQRCRKYLETIKEQQAKINELEFHYKSLMNIDLQLSDLLRSNGIKFRDISDIKDPYWR